MLNLYKNDYSSVPVSQNTNENPVLWEFQQAGTTLEQRFTISCEEGEYFENVILSAKDISGSDEINWCQFAPDINVAPGAYEDEVNVGTILAGSAKHFWMKTSVPGNATPQSKSDVKIKVTAERFNS